MSARFTRLVFLCALSLSMATLASCGDDDAPQTGQPQAAQQAQQAPATQAAPQAQATPLAASATSGAPAPSPESECRQMALCEQKCKSKCMSEEKNRASYLASKKAQLSSSPFEVKIDRIYLDGSCASGDDPKKRKSTSGVKAIVDGVMTYKGDDMLYEADLDGELYLRFGKDRYAEAFAADRTYTGGWYRRVKKASKFDREVRGADPWIKDESREFHWESQPLSEAFCEVIPDEATVYMEIASRGILGGLSRSALQFVPINWEEVVGMAMRQQVNVITKKGKERVLEPADAIYSLRDRILVTRLTGSTQWLKRYSTIQNEPISKAPQAAFPLTVASDEWKVIISGISQAKEFGGFADKGEDQFLAIVDAKIEYTGEEAATPKGMGFRLEVYPGKWVKPASKALGQLDLSSEVSSGGSISGKIVFPRQRFQRPFRLEVKTPDKATLYVDVLSYDIGPDRDPGKK